MKFKSTEISVLLHLEEWREHNTVDVNPVLFNFVVIKEVIENLRTQKMSKLNFNTKKRNNSLFDTKLSTIKIRQIQVEIVSN
jgi:hypothetical protein